MNSHVIETLRSTIGDRCFPVAAAHIWNSLPPSVDCNSFAVSDELSKDIEDRTVTKIICDQQLFVTHFPTVT